MKPQTLAILFVIILVVLILYFKLKQWSSHDHLLQCLTL